MSVYANVNSGLAAGTVDPSPMWPADLDLVLLSVAPLVTMLALYGPSYLIAGFVLSRKFKKTDFALFEFKPRGLTPVVSLAPYLSAIQLLSAGTRPVSTAQPDAAAPAPAAVPAATATAPPALRFR